MKENQKGFGVVEGLLILVIVGLIGFTGWYVWHIKQNTDKINNKAAAVAASTAAQSTKKTATTTTNPYAGWNTATIKYEQISYKYPSTWTLSDSSTPSPKGSDGCVYPGQDKVVLTSPSSHRLEFDTGLLCIGGSGAKTFDSIPVMSLGKNLYITLAAPSEGSTTTNYATSGCLSTTTKQASYPTSDLKSKNIFVNGSSSEAPVNEFCYWTYLSNTSPPQLSISEVEQSADFATAKLVFESMKYVSQ